MKVHSLFLLAILAFVSLSSNAQFQPSDPLPVDPNVRIGKLSNGLTYYIRRNTKPQNKVELRLAVRAGSVLEQENQRGLAHFMEHMNFNGSRHFPKNELVNYLQKVGVKFGADLNAYTGFDQTVYILPISSDNPEVLEKGFTVLEDWAGNNLLDKTEIDKERGVVLEEARLSKGADERMMRQYFPHLFNGSLYAERLPIGNDTLLHTFAPTQLEQFYKQWYRPDLMGVFVVGDIDPALAEKKIKEHFANFSNPVQEIPRPSIIPIPERTVPEAMVLTDDEATNTELEVFNFIRPGTPVKTWGDYRALTVRNLVTALINQRLYELTQKANPPFVYGYTGIQYFIHGYEAFVSFAVLGNSPAKQAVDALVMETERARKFGFLPAELERARQNMMNQIQTAYNERNKSESATLVENYLNNFLEGSPIPGIENRYAFIKETLPTITLAEINQQASQMPSSSNSFVLLTAPTGMKSKLPDNAMLLKDLVAAHHLPIKPYQEKAIADHLLQNEPLPGKTVKETVNERLGTVDLVFSNGVSATLKPTTLKNDEILMDGWRPGGYQKFPLSEKDIAKHSADVISEMGIGAFSPADLQKFLSGKSANVHPYLNDFDEGLDGTSSVKDFETSLQIAYLYFTHPRVDEKLFHSYISKQKSQFLLLKRNPELFYEDTVTKILYHNSPWMEELPTEKEYDRLSASKALADYKNIFGNAYGMHFTFVGNIDTVTAKPLLEKYLGSLPSYPTKAAFKDNGARPVKGIVNSSINKGKEAQSIITVIFSGPAHYSLQENLKLKALIDALNIKIVEKLREEMSGIYTGGLYGIIERIPYEHFTVSASLPCGPENVDKLTTALFSLIKQVQQKGVDQTDLDKVKETLLKQYQVNLQSNNFWLNTLSNSWINHTDPNEVLLYQQQLQALTVKDLQTSARKYLPLNNYVKAVLYPEKKQTGSSSNKRLP